MAPAEPVGPVEDPVDPARTNGQLTVEVALSPGPREVSLVALSLPSGATVEQALIASRLFGPAPDDAVLHSLQVGIWGRKTMLDVQLREGDRIECYRALKVDPKEARRVRYRAHGEKLPKGVHRSRGRPADMTLSPGKAADEPSD